MANKSILRRKKVRLEDVAKVAQISAGTASMAIAGSSRVSAVTRKRVLDACRSLDYQPPRTSQRASQRSQDKTPRIGLLGIGANTANPPNSYLFHHLTRLSHQCHARLEVASIEYAPAHQILDQVIAFARPCDGLLLTGIVSAKLMRLLDEAGISAGSMDLPVQDDPDHAHEPCPGVFFVTDDRAMAVKATRNLLARGHRQIAFISPELEPDQSHHRLYEGYCLAMLNAGLVPDRQLLGVVGRHRDPLRQLVQRLKHLEQPPTAALVLDMMLVNPLIYELQAGNIDIAPEEMILWGAPETAHLYGLTGSQLMGINLQCWAQAALSFAISSPETRIPSGSHICVPFNISQCPPASPMPESTNHSQLHLTAS